MTDFGGMGGWVRFCLRCGPRSVPDRCNERSDAHDLDHPLHVIGKHAQTHLGSDVFERLGESVGAAQPGLERAEHVFDGSPADTHGIG